MTERGGSPISTMPERHHSIPMSETSFGALGVPAPLVAALTRSGMTSAFPIQADTLPDTLNGRDVLGRGKTGSGKTLAFAIPMVARLGGKLAGGQRRAGRPLGLILSPTRELATQIAVAMQPLADAYGLKITTSSAASRSSARSPRSRPASTSSWPAPAGSKTS